MATIIPNLSEVRDLEPVPGGKERELRIIRAVETTSKTTGRNGVLFVIDIVDEDNATDIMHTVWFGNNPAFGKYKAFTGDDESKSNDMWRRVKDFIRAIGLDPDEEIDNEDFVDLEFRAIVELEEDEEYGDRNALGRITGK